MPARRRTVAEPAIPVLLSPPAGARGRDDAPSRVATSGPSSPPPARGRDDDRQHGDGDDDEHNALDRIRDTGDARQKHADRRHGADPRDRSDDVPGDEVPIGHPRSPGREGRIGAHHRHEAPQYEGKRPVTGEERLGRLQPIGAQDPGVVLEQSAPEARAEPVAGLITGDRRHHAYAHDLPQAQAQRAVEDGGRHQQRVPRQEGEQDAGLDEDDDGHSDQHPGAQGREQRPGVGDGAGEAGDPADDVHMRSSRPHRPCGGVRDEPAAPPCAGTVTTADNGIELL